MAGTCARCSWVSESQYRYVRAAEAAHYLGPASFLVSGFWASVSRFWWLCRPQAVVCYRWRDPDDCIKSDAEKTCKDLKRRELCKKDTGWSRGTC